MFEEPRENAVVTAMSTWTAATGCQTVNECYVRKVGSMDDTQIKAIWSCIRAKNKIYEKGIPMNSYIYLFEYPHMNFLSCHFL